MATRLFSVCLGRSPQPGSLPQSHLTQFSLSLPAPSPPCLLQPRSSRMDEILTIWVAAGSDTRPLSIMGSMGSGLCLLGLRKGK